MAEMSSTEMARILSSLVQLDIDAVHAYSQAIQQIEILTIREQLMRFQDDHNRHIVQLSSVIRALDMEPPEYSQDFKGFLIEGFTALRSMTGTEGALKAMKTNEELTNKKYHEASAMPLTPNIKALVERNYKDEKVHLRYVDEVLSNRIWEK